MPSTQTMTFQDVLEIVETLPDSLQDELIEIIRRRRLEQRRIGLANRIAEARAEYDRGEVRRGTVEDLHLQLTVKTKGVPPLCPPSVTVSSSDR